MTFFMGEIATENGELLPKPPALLIQLLANPAIGLFTKLMFGANGAHVTDNERQID